MVAAVPLDECCVMVMKIVLVRVLVLLLLLQLLLLLSKYIFSSIDAIRLACYQKARFHGLFILNLERPMGLHELESKSK